VLRYILEVLPDYLGRRVNFDIICGTSVGGINSAWLASTINEPEYSVQRLWYLWRTLEFAEIVRPSYTEIWRKLRGLLGVDGIFEKAREEKLIERPGGLLKTGFLDDLVRNEIPFHNIRRNLSRGLLDAVTVSSTDIVTGQTTVFLQTKDRKTPPWTRDPRRVVVGGPITARKVLASGAIPFLFPPVKIGNHWFCDGGLRQNTPLSPALRLGADRVLVITLRSRREMSPSGPFEEPADQVDYRQPGFGFLLGKLLDAILLDPLDYDLTVLNRLNGILEFGEKQFGREGFIETLNSVVKEYRGQGYSIVDPLLIRPSEDLGTLASDFAQDVPDNFWGSKVMAKICSSASEYHTYHESDLLSYLLFDGGYTGQLLDLGYGDAKEMHGELVDFFSD
jgi:NTE family protein